MKRILVAVDFSDSSRYAYHSAQKLAAQLDADLRLVYVAPDIFRDEQTQERILPVEPDASELERKMTQWILDDYENAPDEFGHLNKSIREGVEFAEILDEARDWKADLVVAGTHGRSRLGRFFLGSVSDKLLRLGDRKTWIVSQATPALPRKVLVALDGKPGTKAVLERARKFQEQMDCELHLVHVVDERLEPGWLELYPERELLERLRAVWQRVEKDVERLVDETFEKENRPKVQVVQGRPYHEILNLSSQVSADLILVGPHHRHGVLDIGHTALRVAHESGCSIWVERLEA